MKNNTKKYYTKKLRNKKGGTKEETVNKIQEKRNLKQKKKDKINKFLSKEDTKLINRKTREKIAPDSLLRVLTNYTDEQVDNLTEKDLYKAYIIWRKGEAKDRNMSRSLQRGKIPEDGTHHTRKRKSSIGKEELAKAAEIAAEAAAEEQREIYEMNKYGIEEYRMAPRSPTQTMNIYDYPAGFTPHGTKRQRKNSLSMIDSQDLFDVNREIISKEPYEGDLLFNSDMPSPLIETPDI